MIKKYKSRGGRDKMPPKNNFTRNQNNSFNFIITINKYIHMKNKQKTYNINNLKQVIDFNNFI